MITGIKQNFHELLNKDVNRREFLLHVGAAILAVVGIQELLKNLNDPYKIKVRKVISGYGNSIYGR